MSDTITASGSTREALSISSGDLTINGDFTAEEIYGSGRNIKNISIDNIIIGKLNKPLSKMLGGTGNNIYQNEGIVFNDSSGDNNKFNTTYKLKWDKSISTLLINERDFIVDNSNYVTYSSNLLANDIKESSNFISTDIKSYISNNFATPSNAGVVKIGEGLFMNNSGAITIFRENIDIIPPVISPYIVQEQIPNTEYTKIIFTYNPMRGTTFDTERLDNKLIIGKILPFWYNFNNSVNKSINSGNMGNSNVNSIILYGQNENAIKDVIYKPENQKDLFFEYTPLNSNYLYLNGNDNAYASFKDTVKLEKIYGKGGVGGDIEGITICFWFKIENDTGDSIIKKKSLLYFSSDGDNPIYFIDINIQNNNRLSVSLFNIGGIVFSIDDETLCDNTWKHFIWSISKDGLWKIYINGDEKTRDNTKTPDADPVKIVNSSQIVLLVAILKLDPINANYIFKYIGRSSIANNTYLKFSISDIRFYNRELINSEIIELYNSNNYTKYNIEFKDNNSNTSCDILSIGGGGGGSASGGGSAGELKYIETFIRESKHIITVGRGGKGSNIGNNTRFGEFFSKGGDSGNTINNIAPSNIVFSSVFYNTTIITKKNNRYIDPFVIGGGGGGGGSGTQGLITSGGDGIYDIDENLISVNFKSLFDLAINGNIGEYNIQDEKIYFAGGGISNIANGKGGKGGGGNGSIIYDQNLKYNGTNGSGGGGHGSQYAVGGNGIVILRFLNRIIQKSVIEDNINDNIKDISNTLIGLIEDLRERIEVLENRPL